MKKKKQNKTNDNNNKRQKKLSAVESNEKPLVIRKNAKMAISNLESQDFFNSFNKSN